MPVMKKVALQAQICYVSIATAINLTNALNLCKEGSKARAPVHTLPCQPHSNMITCNASTCCDIDINKKIHCCIDVSATARMATLTQSSCFSTSVLESAATYTHTQTKISYAVYSRGSENSHLHISCIITATVAVPRL